MFFEVLVDNLVQFLGNLLGNEFPSILILKEPSFCVSFVVKKMTRRILVLSDTSCILRPYLLRFRHHFLVCLVSWGFSLSKFLRCKSQTEGSEWCMALSTRQETQNDMHLMSRTRMTMKNGSEIWSKLYWGAFMTAYMNIVIAKSCSLIV